MSDLLKAVYDYRNLLSRRDLLRMRLSAEEVARLDALEKLFEWRPEEGGPTSLPLALRRRFARCDVRVPASVKAGSTVQPVVVVNLGGGGVVVEPAPSLKRGELTVLKIRVTSIGREFQFPCQAKWLAGGLNQSAMGLQFIGVPIELRYGVGRSEDVPPYWQMGGKPPAEAA